MKNFNEDLKLIDNNDNIKKNKHLKCWYYVIMNMDIKTDNKYYY